MSHILGISGYYHDSAAAIIKDGEVIAAAQEERFTRKRHDASFPASAVKYCMREAGILPKDLAALVYYEKPLLTFDRLLETYFRFAPKGLKSFVTSMPVWMTEKLFLRGTIENEFAAALGMKKQDLPQLLFSEHHKSHAAAAFYPSPYNEAAVLCMDGVGEWATTSAWLGKGASLEPLWEIKFPHSLGLLYSAITYYTGFKVNSGEYKVMGLAPYGRPIYVKTILENLIDLKPDGSFRLNMKYFNYCTGLTMTNGAFNGLFGGPPRVPEAELTQKEMDLAHSVQIVAEEIVLGLVKKLYAETGMTNLCLAGGVALNCVANGRLLRESRAKNIWIQPAAGDAGSAVGCAMVAYHDYFKKPRTVKAGVPDGMKGAYLGPRHSNEEIEQFLKKLGVPYKFYENEKELVNRVAGDLAAEKVIGWMHGRMEFGPRALGARSILGDPRSRKMQSTMNLKIKFRESFRPFAPSVLRERVAEFFAMDCDSPYMLLVAPVTAGRRIALSTEDSAKWGIDLLNVPKSDIPAVTHVDYSARVQTVHKETNSRYHALISEFDRQTGCPMLVNTSFNVRGEPIVCTPMDAYRCFMRTDIDTLVLENFVLNKVDEPKTADHKEPFNQFELD